jgi:hypothetical protein
VAVCFIRDCGLRFPTQIWRPKSKKYNEASYHYTVEPAYNDSGLGDTSSVALGITLYQLIPHS